MGEPNSAGLLSPPARALVSAAHAGAAVQVNDRARSERAILIVIAVGAVARLALAASIGLGVDESYAVAVARPTSLGYYDHPPLVFWITALIERLGGAHSDVLLRLPFIVLFAATTWLVARIARRSFGPRAAVHAAILLQVIPVFGVSDGGWILPDGPLLLGFALAALALERATAADGRHGAAWWALAGVGAGIAALSKYHAIFLISGALLFLATTAGARRWIARPAPYLAGLIALAMSLPVWIWNARHGWASFRFQGGRADLQHGLHIASLLQNLAGQAGYMLPWIWLALVWQFVAAVRRGPGDRPRWLLACLASGPVIVFPAIALGGRAGLPHWPAPGFLFLVPLLADALARLEQRGRARLVRVYLGGTALLVVSLVAFAASQIQTGWFSSAFPGLFAHGDPSLDALDWRELRPVIDSLSAGRTSVVVASNWIDGAKIGAALAADATVLCFNDDDRQFHFVADQRALAGRPALIVLRATPDADRTLARLASRFAAIDPRPAARLEIHRHANDGVGLIVYRARDLFPPTHLP